MRDLISIEQVQPSYIFWQIRTIVPEKGEEGEEKEHGIHIILAPRQPLSCNESDNYHLKFEFGLKRSHLVPHISKGAEVFVSNLHWVEI